MRDLKQRGLLDTTLVVWGGEFGRTPMSEIRKPEEAGNAGATIIRTATACGWRGAGSRAGR